MIVRARLTDEQLEELRKVIKDVRLPHGYRVDSWFGGNYAVLWDTSDKDSCGLHAVRVAIVETMRCLGSRDTEDVPLRTIKKILQAMGIAEK